MPSSGLLHAVRSMIVSSNGLLASGAGLLTILFCLLTSVLLAFTFFYPEDAGDDGNSSGTYIGEQLAVEEDFFAFCCFLQHNYIIPFKSACLCEHAPTPRQAGTLYYRLGGLDTEDSTVRCRYYAGSVPYSFVNDYMLLDRGQAHTLMVLIITFLSAGFWTFLNS